VVTIEIFYKMRSAYNGEKIPQAGYNLTELSSDFPVSFLLRDTVYLILFYT